MLHCIIFFVIINLTIRLIRAFVACQFVTMEYYPKFPNIRRATMPAKMLITEAELRSAVMDRLIAASLTDGKSAREATLERWRSIGTQCADTGKSTASAS